MSMKRNRLKVLMLLMMGGASFVGAKMNSKEIEDVLHIMNETKVESTTLLALVYDDAHELLQLEFRSSGIYRYFGVPAPVYEALLSAPSKG